jgi:prophage antirepressor-like protein
MQTITKFLEFNGKRINILLADGNWYVAIKPICEALNVDYRKQLLRIHNHITLAKQCTKQDMVAADGKVREMYCISEKYIYGWLFSIQSDSPGLIQYQEKCYEVLYEHFHGQITYRANALSHKSEIRERKATIKAQLAETDLYKEYLELDKKEKICNRRLDSLDIDLISKQISMIL